MLIAALICTVIGLALLVAALATGILPLAWACIGVCVLGFIFLIIDIVKNWPKKAKGEDTTSDTAADDTTPDGTPSGAGAADGATATASADTSSRNN